MTGTRPDTLKALRESGWQSKSVKYELRDNYLKALKSGEPLFPGIVGYDDTVIPEISIAVLATHDMLFCRTSGADGEARGLTCLIVPMDAEGVKIEEYMWTFNMPTDHARVSFKNVWVPDSAVFGPVDNCAGLERVGGGQDHRAEDAL